MKRVVQLSAMLLVIASFMLPAFLCAQDSKEKKLIDDCATAKAAFTKTDSLMSSLFNHSAGYVIFTNVGKGAIGVGGAAGNGIV
ncbi:MAG TPA: hypothetical protein VGG71_03680, partial [Chitinophagaceae bacterium]